ncbi:MAG: TRAP transporter large permease subunit, partial [Devosia sp.]|nr:TRAP transporter large permease subunit [Devosia sp.]
MGRKADLPKDERGSLPQALRALSDASLALVMPIIILGGILFGIFTATEAAGVAVVYALIVSIFIYREVRFSELFGIVLDAAKSAAIIMFAIGAAGLLSWVINYSQMAFELSSILTAVTTDGTVMLLLIALLLL